MELRSSADRHVSWAAVYLGSAMADGFTIGDWVRIHKAGIWQVYRTLTIKCLDPVDGAETTRQIVFSKRFLTNAFRKSLGQDCCAPQLVRPLSKQDQQELESFIANNKQHYDQFLAYTPKPIDIIFNARIAAPEGLSAEQVQSAVTTDRKLAEPEIQPYLEQLGFRDGFPSWTVQFVSADHECGADGYLLYSFAHILTS